MAFYVSEPSSESAALVASSDLIIFSDSLETRSPTPPSSPPQQPLESTSSLEPDNLKRPQLQNAFSILGKRKALSAIPQNAIPTPSKRVKASAQTPSKTLQHSSPATKSTKTTSLTPSDRPCNSNSNSNPTTLPTKTPPLTQMRLSLGQATQRHCPTCKMTYILSSAEDRKLHKQFCSSTNLTAADGIRVSSNFTHNFSRSLQEIGPTPSTAQKETVTAAARAVSESRGDVLPGLRKGDAICVINRASTALYRRRAGEVLRHVQEHLGAVEISEGELWGDSAGQPEAKANAGGKGKGLKARGAAGVVGEDAKAGLGRTRGLGGRYRALLYEREDRIIGFLLVERIKEARTVLAPAEVAHASRRTKSGQSAAGTGSDTGAAKGASTRQGSGRGRAAAATAGATSALNALRAHRLAHTTALSSPLHLSPNPAPAFLGISRIWTAPAHRGEGIAPALLDAAYTNLAYWWARSGDEGGDVGEGVLVGDRESVRARGKGLVAFSQPTEAGTKLARRWVGRDGGWCVYVD